MVLVIEHFILCMIIELANCLLNIKLETCKCPNSLTFNICGFYFFRLLGQDLIFIFFIVIKIVSKAQIRVRNYF